MIFLLVKYRQRIRVTRERRDTTRWINYPTRVIHQEILKHFPFVLADHRAPSLFIQSQLSKDQRHSQGLLFEANKQHYHTSSNNVDLTQ